MAPMFPTFTIESAGHLIQVALTPVFLLSGIAALLNVFASRLARVADRLDSLHDGIAADGLDSRQTGEMTLLHMRSVALDVAVVLATVAAALTCLAILTLFLFALSNKVIAGFLVAFFGLAIVCTLGSVGAFGVEMLMSSRELRQRMLFHLPDLRWLIRRN